jgi:hypothetical protein
MKANFSVTNSVDERTIRVRMLGEFDSRTMLRFVEEYRRVSDGYSGRRHMILADMRGTVPIAAEPAAILGEAIAYSRRNGVVRCAHLSDDTVQKLQASRLGRSMSEHDRATVEVISIDEAERVLAECRASLAD